MKLHLGCGTKHIEGYINIDVRYLPHLDENSILMSPNIEVIK